MGSRVQAGPRDAGESEPVASGHAPAYHRCGRTCHNTWIAVFGYARRHVTAAMGVIRDTGGLMSAVRKVNEESLAEAASVIAGGGLVVIPTDTVYGVCLLYTSPSPRDS